MSAVCFSIIFNVSSSQSLVTLSVGGGTDVYHNLHFSSFKNAKNVSTKKEDLSSNQPDLHVVNCLSCSFNSHQHIIRLLLSLIHFIIYSICSGPNQGKIIKLELVHISKSLTSWMNCSIRSTVISF